jgi:hypothetical protein
LAPPLVAVGDRVDETVEKEEILSVLLDGLTSAWAPAIVADSSSVPVCADSRTSVARLLPPGAMSPSGQVIVPPTVHEPPSA